jgi:hypothetical protein
MKVEDEFAQDEKRKLIRRDVFDPEREDGITCSSRRGEEYRVMVLVNVNVFTLREIRMCEGDAG